MLDFLKQVKLDEPLFLRNVTLYPLKGEIGSNGFTTLDEALERKDASFKDVLDVNSVELDYRGGAPLFIMDGEEIIGARQDRVVNTAVFAEPNTRAVIPVSCIEEGRWSGGEEFKPGYFSVTPSLRSILASTVTDSLKNSGKFMSNQSLIWKTVRDTLKVTGVQSVTGSFHDVVRSLGEEIEEYVEEYETPEDITGFIAYVNNSFVGMDLFATRGLYKKLENKLLKSYALEGVIRQRVKKKSLEIEPHELIKHLINNKFEAFKSVIKGTEWRLKEENLVARALTVKENPVHVAVFSV